MNLMNLKNLKVESWGKAIQWIKSMTWEIFHLYWNRWGTWWKWKIYIWTWMKWILAHQIYYFQYNLEWFLGQKVHQQGKCANNLIDCNPVMILERSVEEWTNVLGALLGQPTPIWSNVCFSGFTALKPAVQETESNLWILRTCHFPSCGPKGISYCTAHHNIHSSEAGNQNRTTSATSRPTNSTSQPTSLANPLTPSPPWSSEIIA